MSSADFVPFITLPDVIDGAGLYVTRCGEVVNMQRASTRHDFGCKGYYVTAGIRDSWHKSGRILFGQETVNDIVRKVQP